MTNQNVKTTKKFDYTRDFDRSVEKKEMIKIYITSISCTLVAALSMVLMCYQAWAYYIGPLSLLVTTWILLKGFYEEYKETKELQKTGDNEA